MNRLREASKVTLEGIMETVMYLPVLLLIGGYAASGRDPYSWMAALVFGYPAGYLLNRYAGFRHGFPILILGSVIGCVYGLAGFGLTVLGALAAAAAAFGLYRGARRVASAWTERFTIGHFGVGLFLYFFYSAIFLRMERFAEHRFLVLAGGIAALALMLYFTNKRVIEGESNQRAGASQVERSVKQLNRSLVGLILLLSAAVVFTNQLQLWLRSVWAAAAEWIRQLLAKGGGGQAPLQEPQLPEQQKPMLPDAGEQAPSPWMDWIMYGLLIVVGVIVLWLLLRRVKHLPNLLRILAAGIGKLFRRQRPQPLQGYVDEIVAVEKPKRWRQWLKKNLSGEARVRWTELTDNKARMRYLYRQWLAHIVKNGQPFQVSQTPMEISRTAAQLGTDRVTTHDSTRPADLYSAMQYGQQEIRDEQIEELAYALQLKRK